MSTLNKVEFTQCMITPNDVEYYLKNNPNGIGGAESGVDKPDLEDEKDVSDKFPDLAKSKSITAIDYFEDILSPAVSCYVHVSDTTNLLAKLPIRGYERVDLKVSLTENQSFSFNNDNTPLFVQSIENIQRTESQETFVICMSTVGNLRNEITRCEKRYKKAPISEHVKSILKEKLKIDEGRLKVDPCATEYDFQGNMRKPFFLITGLAPKTQPVKEGEQGTSGFVFYEDYEGYKFRSIDSLLDKANDEVQKLGDDDDRKKVDTFTYTTAIGRAEEGEDDNKILDYFIDKAVDIQKNLRVGLYSNLTITFDPVNWEMKSTPYKLKDNVNGKDGQTTAGPDVPIPQNDLFADNPSRRLVRIMDSGMIEKNLEPNDDGKARGSGRDERDMAKSFSRYSLLFQQSLNITIACNNGIRVGQVIQVVIPDVGPSESGDGGADDKGADLEISGIYLVRALRHHFELGDGRNVTSLNLVRDSYGLN